MQQSKIRNETEYNRAIARLEVIFDAKTGTPEYQEMEALADLIEEYDSANYPIDPPTPEQAAIFRAEQMKAI